MEHAKEMKIPKRVLNTLLLSLDAGVVPRSGAPYIAIGRQEEIRAFLSDLELVKDGGATVRFLIGRYGSGKSFLIQLIRGYALENNFLTADCDLSPERRLSGGHGGGIATYRELLRNLASKASPDGGALHSLLLRHYTKTSADLVAEGMDPDSADFIPALKRRLLLSLYDLENGVGGFDFARILGIYYEAVITDQDEKRSAALKWLRGEFTTKTEAKAALGMAQVNTLISDENWYDFIKLWAHFARLVGYNGLIVYIDECVNLYKIPNRISREANYEKLLAIFNDALQGRAEGLGVIFGGTPQFLEDTRRGLFSYEALRSRLADSRFTELGYRTMSSPVIRLRRLSDNELLALLSRLSKLFAERDGIEELVTPEQLTAFLREILSRVGAEENLTPREIIRNFLSLLSVLRENPDADFGTLLRRFAGNEAEENPNGIEPDESTEESVLGGAAYRPERAAEKAFSVSLSDLEF